MDPLQNQMKPHHSVREYMERLATKELKYLTLCCAGCNNATDYAQYNEIAVDILEKRCKKTK